MSDNLYENREWHGVRDGVNTFVYQECNNYGIVNAVSTCWHPDGSIMIENGSVYISSDKKEIQSALNVNGYTLDGDFIVDCLGDRHNIFERHGRTLLVESFFASSGIEGSGYGDEEYVDIDEDKIDEYLDEYYLT